MLTQNPFHMVTSGTLHQAPYVVTSTSCYMNKVDGIDNSFLTKATNTIMVQVSSKVIQSQHQYILHDHIHKTRYIHVCYHSFISCEWSLCLCERSFLHVCDYSLRVCDMFDYSSQMCGILAHTRLLKKCT